MRSTPHPLTTIVAYSADPAGPVGNREDKVRGLLVSSFNTVTLYPKPFVSFNIKRPSSTYDAICQSGSFTASGINNATVADGFVKSRGTSKAWEQRVGKEGRLKDGKGGTWWMICQLVKEHLLKVGDHVVVIGEVLDAGSYSAGQEKSGIVYVKGTYRRTGEILNASDESR